MIFLQLFITFFKIGLFGFGGGYAMLSLIRAEVVTRHLWISSGEFTDIVAVSQMTPGPIGINSATYIGYTSVVNQGLPPVLGVLGSVTASVAVVLPSFILMMLVTRFFMKYQKTHAVESVFHGIRPAVIGLIASAALLLMTNENFGSFVAGGDNFRFYASVMIFLAAFVMTGRLRVSPILTIVLAGVAGWLLF